MADRIIALSEGGGMGDNLYVFATNVSEDTLQSMERLCQQMLKKGYDHEELPVWATILDNGNNHSFSYVDEHVNVSPYGKASSWLKERYPECKEIYYLQGGKNYEQ